MGVTPEVVLERLKKKARPSDLEGMARFGIPATMNLGVRVPELRRIARELGKDSTLAMGLWQSGYREARLIAGMILNESELTDELMEKWLKEFDSWEITDGTMLNCFWKYPEACGKALEWSRRKEEFQKRAGFSLMAILAVKQKKLDDAEFLPFLDAIEREAADERNFVKKAVNWALRQIGKRNPSLNRLSVRLAERLKSSGSRAARWIASDALRELTGEAVGARLGKSAHSRG